jgi:hypothetical protein
MGIPEEAVNQAAEAVWEAVFAGLIRLRDQWPARAWEYDRRLRCVSSSIPLADEAAARAAMAGVLDTAWSATTLASAPDSASPPRLPIAQADVARTWPSLSRSAEFSAGSTSLFV